MKITKFEGLGRTEIRVHFGNRKILINGELTMTPIFYAEKSSIKNWGYPNENQEVSIDDKLKIIKAIEDYTKKTKIKVIFE